MPAWEPAAPRNALRLLDSGGLSAGCRAHSGAISPPTFWPLYEVSLSINISDTRNTGFRVGVSVT